MMQSVYVFEILAACIISSNLIYSAQAKHATTNVFKQPQDSELSETENNYLPWVKPEYQAIIDEFQMHVFEDLKASPPVQNIWDFTTDSKTTRDIFFKLLNEFFTEIGHPVPTAFANVVSKTGSLFDPITMPIMFLADAVSLGEFLIAHNIEIDRSTSQRYVSYISEELVKADSQKPESVWQAFLKGYLGFIESYGFNIADEVDEFFLLFTNELIVLYNIINGLP